MMGHNVWMHINAVQEANRQYDAGKCPNMLVDERFDRLFFKDIVEAIFATSDKGTALQLVEEFNSFWNRVIGTRGASGKKATNPNTKFAELFDNIEPEVVQLDEEVEFDESAISKLDDLEVQLHNDIT
jgi:hypothetical protein